MLERIRNAIARKNLRRAVAAQSRRRRAHTLESARVIGILFDATPERNRREVLEFAKNLEKQGKKVSLLGFINDKKQAAGEQPFSFFTPKELRWNGQINSEKALAFGAQKFDLLLSLNPDGLLPLHLLAAQSPAAMKVGFVTATSNDYDMLLEIPADKGLRFFVEQLELYLDKLILTTAHEPATAS